MMAAIGKATLPNRENWGTRIGYLFVTLTETTFTSFLSASTFAVRITCWPSWPLMSSGLTMVQFLRSPSVTKVCPVLLIVPVREIGFRDAGVLWPSSWFIVSWAAVAPIANKDDTKQIVISFFTLPPSISNGPLLPLPQGL